MWLFFKDFAGPIATVMASIVAVTVTAYFARHQKIIALAQRDIANEKLRLDLFDRRYEVFKSMFSYYNAIVGWKNTEEQVIARSEFFGAYQKSKFYFHMRQKWCSKI